MNVGKEPFGSSGGRGGPGAVSLVWGGGEDLRSVAQSAVGHREDRRPDLCSTARDGLVGADLDADRVVVPGETRGRGVLAFKHGPPVPVYPVEHGHE